MCRGNYRKVQCCPRLEAKKCRNRNLWVVWVCRPQVKTIAGITFLLCCLSKIDGLMYISRLSLFYFLLHNNAKLRRIAFLVPNKGIFLRFLTFLKV